MKKVIQVEDHTYVSEFKTGEHLSVSIYDGNGYDSSPTLSPSEAYEKPKVISKGDKKWASWGKDNKLPLHLMNLVLNNNMAPGNLDTKDQIMLGDRLVFYYDKFEDGKFKPTVFEDTEMYDWLEEIEAEKYRQEAVIDFNYFSNFFVMLQGGQGNLSNKVVKIKHVDATDCRAEIMDEKSGKVLNYGVSDWSKRNSPVKVYSAYDAERFLEKGGNAIMHQKKRTPGNPYYSLPVYFGAQNWLKHANKIPIWKSSNMDNSINVKYHIQIPERYFLAIWPDGKYTAEFRQQKFEEKIAEMSEFLSGAKNVGKAFYSQFAMDKTTGQPLPGWKIDPIPNNINHEAYSKDFEDATSAILSSMAVDPNLSGVIMSSKLGTGSEKRESYNFHVKVLTRYGRQLSLEPLYESMKNWGYHKRVVDGAERRIKIGIQDIELTTMDVNPNASQKTFESNPTGQKKAA